MAQDQQSVQLTIDAWTQLTNADVTEMTFQVLTGEAFIRYTSDTTTPTESEGVRALEGEGPLQLTLSEQTYLTGAVRVWAKPVSSKACLVYVDHA